MVRESDAELLQHTSPEEVNESKEPTAGFEGSDESDSASIGFPSESAGDGWGLVNVPGKESLRPMATQEEQKLISETGPDEHENQDKITTAPSDAELVALDRITSDLPDLNSQATMAEPQQSNVKKLGILTSQLPPMVDSIREKDEGDDWEPGEGVTGIKVRSSVIAVHAGELAQQDPQFAAAKQPTEDEIRSASYTPPPKLPQVIDSIEEHSTPGVQKGIDDQSEQISVPLKAKDLKVDTLLPERMLRTSSPVGSERLFPRDSLSGPSRVASGISRVPSSPKGATFARPFSTIRLHAKKILRFSRVGSVRRPRRGSNASDTLHGESPRRTNQPLKEDSTQFLEDVWENEVVRAAAAYLNNLMAARRQWHGRASVYLVMFCVLFCLSVLSTVFPARHLSELVPLAPIVNEAGRREAITKSIVMHSRELVLNDGLMRKDRNDLSASLDFLIRDHRRTDEAIRLGESLGIEKGADHRNEEHNKIMYEGHCPWTSDQQCHVDEKPSANGQGLLYLSRTVIDAAKSVLHRYGDYNMEKSDEAQGAILMQFPEDWQDPHRYETVHINETLYRKLEEDADMKLLMDSFDGELVHGYRHIEHVFDAEMDHFLNKAIHENDLLFATYIVTILVIFYFCLFRRTLKHSLREVHAAQEFALQIPAHILTNQEVDCVRRCLCHDLENDQQDAEFD